MKIHTRIRKAPQPDLVDLHVHSSVSDGALAPRDLVRHAREVGLKAIALTDHDTVAGVPEALAAGRECGIEVIAGAEISAEIAEGACHILGYFLDPANRALGEVLDAARGGREVRNAKILDALCAIGLPLTADDLAGRAEDGVITRAHFAGAMLAKGYVKSWDEAFDKYLGHGKPAYVRRDRVLPADAIRVIHEAGGLAALAHPRQLNRGPRETDAYIEELARAGLDAVETRSPDHTASLARRYRAAAARLDLLETGGTDWHGHAEGPHEASDLHGGIHLGVGRGSMAIHYEVVQAMKDRLAARRNGKV